MSFGVLTLATPNDYRKAIGLALSLRVSNPGVPVAVACAARLRPLVEPYFDHVIDEDPTLRGFIHKVYLDRYSPFDDTFFFDSDVLVFRDVRPKAEEWSDQAYNACGNYLADGFSAFGLDRKAVRIMLGKEHLVEIGGAGHAYFRKPACEPVFDLARKVSHDYRRYAGDAKYADEDAMNIVMTMLDIRPRQHWGFFSCPYSALPRTLKMDATIGQCEMIERSTGKALQPHMMHFMANQAPFPYARQLRNLFKKFGADASGIYRIALEDFWELEVKWRAKQAIKKVLGRRAPVNKTA